MISVQVNSVVTCSYLMDHCPLLTRGGAEPKYGIQKGTNNSLVYEYLYQTNTLKNIYIREQEKTYIKKLSFFMRPQCMRRG